MSLSSAVPVATSPRRLRIGVDYRILSSSLNLSRGMGRYTQQQLREVLRLDPVNEYILFCPPRADQTLILPEIRAAPNVSLATIDLPSGEGRADPNEPGQVLRLAEAYQAWIYRQQVDLYHATAPFTWDQLILPRFDACPMVINFYDAIPLIFPDRYFSKQDPTADLYARATRFILEARRFIAISESARQDATLMLGFPAERIDIAYPIADPCFQVLSSEAIASRLQGLRARMALPERFALAVTHLHYSKGIENLLDGYARLAPSLRRELPLVITCHLTPFEVQYLKGLAESRGVGGEVVLTGQVSDAELAALYNAALLFVHVSRYEGFGLPVLEAMQCGAPVIVTDSSSLPEVGGHAARRVPLDDPPALAGAIEALYHDPAQRAAMREASLAQARKFDADQLGRGTLDAYYRAVQPAEPVAAARPSLALWTPLPPQHSGVADYSANVLLGPLAQHYDVEVFVDDGVWPGPDLGRAYKVQHYSAFERRQAQRPFDVIVYQLGASLFHVYMYPFVQKYPGVVVLHDLVWSYAMWSWLSPANRLNEFQQELLETEGADAVARWQAVLREPPGARHADLFAFFDSHPMLSKVVASSRGIIMLLPYLADELKQRYGTDKVFVVPHGAEDVLRARDESSQEVRESLGLPGEAFVVGVFGILDPVKRLDVVLRAFAQLAAQEPQTWLVMAGEALDPIYGASLHELADSLGVAEHVVFTGYVSDEALQRWTVASDVVVNLRYPSRKQMSGTLVRAIAAGKPVFITDLPEWRALPEDFCWRVPAGERELDTLADGLAQLATNGLLRETLSARARAYYERELTPTRMVEQYEAVFAQVLGPQATPAPMPPAVPGPLPLNKPMEVEDFERPDLKALIGEIEGPGIGATPEAWRGSDYRHFWAASMAVCALREAGCLSREARILVIGAGRSALQYYLTLHAGQVFSVDRYLTLNLGTRSLLVQPGLAAPYAAEVERLVVQHMDARVLRFPDQSFEAVVVAQPLRQLGNPAEIAGVLFEIGRVLKPTGVVSLTLDYKLAGPPGGAGWDSNRPLLSRAGLDHWVVEASGLELAGEVRLEPTGRTLSAPRRLDVQATDIAERFSGQPEFVSVVQGYATIPVHLALRKTAAYPVSDNQWAQPTPALRENLRHEGAALLTRAGNTAGSLAAQQTATPSPASANANSLDIARARLKSWSLIRIKGWYNNALRHLPGPLAYLGRSVTRVIYLGHSQQAQEDFYQALLDHLSVTQMQLATVSGRTEELTKQLQDLASTAHASQQALHRDVGHELGRLSEHETTLRQVQADIERLQETVRKQIEAEDSERQAAAMLRLTSQVQQLAGQVALLRQLPGVAAPRPDEAAGLSPDELVELLRCLDQSVTGLAGAQSVELSLQPGAEATLFAGTAYLGQRMASSGSLYRTPNDLWIHVDFTDAWNREVLFDSALARLAAGGWFVLCTAVKHNPPAIAPGLALVDEPSFSLGSGRPVNALVWRKEPAPAA